MVKGHIESFEWKKIGVNELYYKIEYQGSTIFFSCKATL